MWHHCAAVADPSSEQHAQTEAEPTADGPGRELDRGAAKIGRFSILRKIGHGGMGVVYAGYDDRLDRKVAIKLLRHHTGDAALHRLAREAQGLARLSHPNVVQIYEIGEHEGTTFIAMEFVDGQTLGAWFREKPRPRAELLAVMQSAGRGLAAAHAKGLIHRDFKPDNVMIDSEGRVRVMDFGLVHGALGPEDSYPAGVTLDGLADPPGDPPCEPSVSPLSDRLTATGSTLGTPAYMPPEQHTGALTDERSDQFSFCVALWELLYGQRPFTGANVAQLYLAVSSHTLREPPREVAVPTWLRKIIERGLAADPAQRWPSMHELLEALADDPRRRRIFVVGISSVLALVIGALALRGVLLERARARVIQACADEGASIEAQWNDARVAELEAGFLASDQPFAADSWSRTHAQLADYAAQWSHQRSSICRAATLDQTRTLASLTHARACLDDARAAFDATIDVLGSADAGLVAHAARLPHALPRLSSCADEATLARRSLKPTDELAELADPRAQLQRASALRLVGEYEQALALTEQIATTAPPLEAEARLLIGDLHARLGHYEASQHEYERAFRLAGVAGADVIALRAATELCSIVGRDLGHHELGRLWAQVGDVLLHRLGLADGVDAASLHMSVAQLEFHAGDLDAALDRATRARELFVTVLGPRHADVADALLELVAIHDARDQTELALELAERALEIVEDAYGPNHPAVAKVQAKLGGILDARGELEAARERHARALAIREAAFGPEHPSVADSLHALARLELSQGRNSEALPLLERALAITQATYGPEHDKVANVLENIVVVQQRLGRVDEAITNNRRAQVILERALGPEHPRVAKSLTLTAQFLTGQGDHDAAQAAYERSLAIYEAQFGPKHTSVAHTIVGLASVLEARGDLPGALAGYERALALLEDTLGPDHYELSDPLYLIGYLLQIDDEYDRALAAFERSLSIELAAGGGGARTAETRLNIAECLWALGDRDAARAQGLAAREDLRGEETPEQLAELEGWLAKHASP
jgi:eukaryotic-like serine/threonine-protein kinase